MIYNRQLLPSGNVASLACDSCGVVLFVPSMIDGWCDLNPDQEPTDMHRAALRAVAQQNGWAFILVSCISADQRDLCPACFTLPREG